MIKKLLLATLLALVAGPALAQNTQCSNRPNGDSTNSCANTRFVQSAVSGGTGLTVGTSTISGGVNTQVLFDNSGVLGEYTNTQLTALINAATASLPGLVPAWPNNTATVFLGNGAYGQVGNSALVNPATTVNGQTCTLGSTCTVTTAAASVAIGTTTITSGTNAFLLYNNSGTLGNESVATALSGVTLTGGLNLGSQTLAGTGTFSGTIAFTNATTAISLANVGSFSWTGATTFLFQPHTQTLYISTTGGVGTCSISGFTMTCTAMTSGAFVTTQTLTGSGVTGGTTITAYGTGSGGAGNYTVSASQSVSATSITGTGSATPYTIPSYSFDTSVVGSGEFRVDARGHLLIGDIPTWNANLSCNEGFSSSLCSDTGPALRIVGDIAAGDYEFIGAKSNAGNEVQQLGVRLWGAFGSSTLIGAGWQGFATGNDSSATHCTSTSTMCASGEIVIQPDDSNQNSAYLGAGSVSIYAHGSQGTTGQNEIGFYTRNGANTNALRWYIDTTGSLFAGSGNAYDIGSSGTLVHSIFYGNLLFGPTHAGGGGAGSSLTLESTTVAGTSDFINFKTGSQVEAARFDTAQHYLQGLTSAIAAGGATGVGLTSFWQLAGAGAAASFTVLRYNGGGGGGALFNLGSSPGVAVGTFGATAANVGLGSFNFYGDDGVAYTGTAAQIAAVSDGVFSNSSHPARLTFSTTAASSTAQPTERMRISNDGGVTIGTFASSPGSGNLSIGGTLAVVGMASNTGAQSGYVCYNSSTGVTTYDGTNTCLVSSRRFKTNIEPISPAKAMDAILAMRPVSYRYDRDFLPRGERLGFIAEEMAELKSDRLRSALVGFDGEGRPLNVRDTFLPTLLVGALQELKADNDNIRAELETLKRKSR